MPLTSSLSRLCDGPLATLRSSSATSGIDQASSVAIRRIRISSHEHVCRKLVEAPHFVQAPRTSTSSGQTPPRVGAFVFLPPFVVSLSNHDSATPASFDKLRTNGSGDGN